MWVTPLCTLFLWGGSVPLTGFGEAESHGGEPRWQGSEGGFPLTTRQGNEALHLTIARNWILPRIVATRK